ncbi:Hypothetical protein SMAX5B_015152 [Scophthalmus maximus]|uniref:Uncharacterized protein n=1 Tax=Scophthalmus maximus TaxID=52904 RepID=A0A2U9CEA1_SCOMX|nr:Hypothetical protein SMAX5B_015152 [Scophthalmus maximus]
MNGCRRRRASFVRAETGFNEDNDVTNEVIISGFLCETGLLEKIFTQEEELDFVR